MNRNTRIRLQGAVALLLGAAVLAVVLRPQAVLVDVAAASARTLTVVIEEQGRTRARDPFIVAAPITGRLLRTSLRAGDRVEAGETIARIALPPDDLRTEAVAQANLIAAEARKVAVDASLVELQSALARAMSEEERRAELYKTNITTAEELEYYRQLTEAARARVLAASASLQAAEAEVESARSQLLGRVGDPEAGILNISAPVTGTVYRIYEESERVLQAGTPLFAISRDDALELVVDLLTQDAVQVRPGQPLLVSGWGGEVLQGEVQRVEPEAFTKVSALGVEEQRVNVIGTLPEVPDSLGAGYRIDVAVVVWEEDGVLTVPSSAVFQRNGQPQVFVLTADGRAALRPLQTGRRNREYIQVLDGLEADEQVILFPSDLISPGVRVVARQ